MMRRLRGDDRGKSAGMQSRSMGDPPFSQQHNRHGPRILFFLHAVQPHSQLTRLALADQDERRVGQGESRDH